MTSRSARAAKGRSVKPLPTSRAGRRGQLTADGQRPGYVEILPGVWQPAGMAEAERWKRAQLKRSKT